MEHHEFGSEKFHVEMQIEDSVLVIVYVKNVDETYKRTIRLGTKPILEPIEKPYQERQAGFKDAAGNTWWISTYRT